MHAAQASDNVSSSDTRLPHWPWSQPGRYYGRAGYRDDVGGGSCTSNGRYDRADISASQPKAGWLTVGVRRHPREVGPLARGAMSPEGSAPIRPITGRLSLAP